MEGWREEGSESEKRREAGRNRRLRKKEGGGRTGWVGAGHCLQTSEAQGHHPLHDNTYTHIGTHTQTKLSRLYLIICSPCAAQIVVSILKNTLHMWLSQQMSWERCWCNYLMRLYPSSHYLCTLMVLWESAGDWTGHQCIARHTHTIQSYTHLQAIQSPNDPNAYFWTVPREKLLNNHSFSVSPHADVFRNTTNNKRIKLLDTIHRYLFSTKAVSVLVLKLGQVISFWSTFY